MGPGVDQNLTLKAALKDEVTPTLKSIEGALAQSEKSLKELLGVVKQLAEGLKKNFTKSKDTVATTASSIKADLGKTGEAFKDLEKTAKSSSENISTAVRQSLGARDVEKTFGTLDKDLGDLNKTFSGFATTSKSASVKGKKISAIGKDVLNKKVTPAFQGLYDTLDDYPEVLEDINNALKDQAKTSGGLGSSLDGVSERVSGLGDTFKKIKFDLEDFAGALAGGFTYQAANKLQTKQFEVGQIAGIDDAVKLPAIWEQTLKQSQAPIEVWEGGMKTLMELTSVSAEEMPGVITNFVNLSKVTGQSVDDIAIMYDSLVKIGGLKESEFTSVFANMNQMAKEGRVSIEELSGALQGVAEDMRMLTKEGRAAYAEAMLAGTATLKEMGMEGVESMDSFKKRIMSDTQAYTSAAAAANRIGVSGQEFDEAYAKGEFDKLYNWFSAGADQVIKESLPNYAEGKTLKPWETGAAQSILPGMPLSPEYIANLRGSREKYTEENPELQGLTGRAYADAQTALGRQKLQRGSEQAMADQTAYQRGLIPEQRERAEAVYQNAQLRVGAAGAPVIQNAQEKLVGMAQSGMDAFTRWDDKYNQMFSSAMAYYGLASPFKTLFKNLSQFIPGVGGKISEAMDSPIGGAVSTGLTMFGLKKLFGGGEAAAPTFGGAPTGATFGGAPTGATFGGAPTGATFGGAPVAATGATATALLNPFETQAAKSMGGQPNYMATMTAAKSMGGQPDYMATMTNAISSAGLDIKTATVEEVTRAMQEYQAKGMGGTPTLLGAAPAAPAAAAAAAYPGQARVTSATAYPGQVPPQQPQFEPEGPSIAKALSRRVDKEIANAKQVGQIVLDTMMPFRKEAMVVMKSFVHTQVEVQKKAAGAIKSFATQAIDTQKSVLVGLIAGDMNEAQRQKKEQVSSYIAQNQQYLDTVGGNAGDATLEQTKNINEQQLATLVELAEINAEMRQSIETILRERAEKGTQPPRPINMPMAGAQEEFMAQ